MVEKAHRKHWDWDYFLNENRSKLGIVYLYNGMESPVC